MGLELDQQPPSPRPPTPRPLPPQQQAYQWYQNRQWHAQSNVNIDQATITLANCNINSVNTHGVGNRGTLREECIRVSVIPYTDLNLSGTIWHILQKRYPRRSGRTYQKTEGVDWRCWRGFGPRVKAAPLRRREGFGGDHNYKVVRHCLLENQWLGTFFRCSELISLGNY